MSREPFDYERWRDKYFAGKNLPEIFGEAREAAWRD